MGHGGQSLGNDLLLWEIPKQLTLFEMAPAADFSMNFFSHMTESAAIFPKPEIYFLLETKHKFGFSFLKEEKRLNCIGITVQQHILSHLLL